jgi:cold shock CspA family protein
VSAIIDSYFRDKQWGWCALPDGMRVYFHLDRFYAESPPPIIGEPVVVEGVKHHHDGRFPKAGKVLRTTPPLYATGFVQSFDPKVGWGFVQSSTGDVCFLHATELVRPEVLSRGMRVGFYIGNKKSRIRACHVTVLGDV